MLPALAEAKKVQAAAETASAVASINARLAAIEAKLDRLLEASEVSPPAPTPKSKGH